MSLLTSFCCQQTVAHLALSSYGVHGRRNPCQRHMLSTGEAVPSLELSKSPLFLRHGGKMYPLSLPLLLFFLLGSLLLFLPLQVFISEPLLHTTETPKK